MNIVPNWCHDIQSFSAQHPELERLICDDLDRDLRVEPRIELSLLVWLTEDMLAFETFLDLYGCLDSNVG